MPLTNHVSVVIEEFNSTAGAWEVAEQLLSHFPHLKLWIFLPNLCSRRPQKALYTVKRVGASLYTNSTTSVEQGVKLPGKMSNQVLLDSTVSTADLNIFVTASKNRTIHKNRDKKDQRER